MIDLQRFKRNEDAFNPFDGKGVKIDDIDDGGICAQCGYEPGSNPECRSCESLIRDPRRPPKRRNLPAHSALGTVRKR